MSTISIVAREASLRMKVEIALDGKNHQVELAKVGERLRCTIDGAPLEADAVQKCRRAFIRF